MILSEICYGLQSLAEEALSIEGVQNALKSRKFKAVVTAGILSTAFDTSVGLNNLDNGEYQDAASSAIHVAVELAVVEGLRRLIPGVELYTQPDPINNPQISQPQFLNSVISLSNG